MSGIEKEYQSLLRKAGLTRRIGLLLAELIFALGLFVLLFAVYVFADYFFAFSSNVIFVLNFIVTGVPACIFLVGAARALSLSGKSVAGFMDALSGNSRQYILSAHELSTSSSSSPDGIREFLVGKVIGNAVEELRGIAFSKYFPLPEIGGRCKMAAIELIASAVILGINPEASKVIAMRILHPYEDIPPYSEYVFKISPESPKAVYGGDLELSVEIGSKEPREQVWFYTKDLDGNIHKTACFKEAGNKFAQRIEKVTQPVKFCFSIGKARSKWKEATILLRPRITMAKLKVIPPKYSALPVKTFILSDDRISELKGAVAELTIASNRPLAGGYMTLRGEDEEEGRKLMAENSGLKSVKFKWPVNGKAELEFIISDVQGTKAEEPLRIEQFIESDAMPEAAIYEPEIFMLATPGATLDIEGSASDDLGLKRVDLVRSVVGYHDRIKRVGPREFRQEFDYSSIIDLGKLGVEPGQTLEFYIEAFDYNPALTGFCASEIVRVQIISEKEYAEILRSRRAIQEMFARYQIMYYKFFEFKKKLSEIKEKAEKGKLTKEEKEKLLKEARKALSAAKEQIVEFTEDFPIYEMEERQKEALKKVLDKMVESEMILSGIDSSIDNAALKEKINLIIKILSESEGKLREMQEEVNNLEKLSKAMDFAAKFAGIVKRQKEIVRKLRIFETNRSPDRIPRLKGYSRRETELSESLAKAVSELERISKELQDIFKKIAEDSKEFIAEFKRKDPCKYMNEAALFAKNSDGRQACRSAVLALEKLMELMNKENIISAMCRGDMCGNIPQKMRMTADQLLKSMFCKEKAAPLDGAGNGGNGGDGGNIGGDPNDGYHSSGFSSLDIPVKGPKRRSLSKSDSPGGGQQSGGGGKKGSCDNACKFISKKNSETMKGQGRKETKTRSVQVDSVPEKYRDAVKKYFKGELK